MHMRNKHSAGTKQEIERESGIRLRENLLKDKAHIELQNNKDLLQQIVHPSKLKEKLGISDDL
jgi:hypothetical protein